MGTDIHWVVAVIDRPFGKVDEAARFWAAVSGTVAQPVKHDRFIELRRPDVDDWLLVQGVLDGPPGIHLDFSVGDPDAFVRQATAAGATVSADHGSWQVLTSPAGLAFCVAAWKGEHRRETLTRVDQVCLDLAPSEFDAELAFWATLTGWPVDGAHARLRPTGPIPIGLRLHRLDGEQPASAHLDVACSEVSATRARHERLGATFVGAGPHGPVLLDPAGAPYCLEHR
ncbi:VOC family protein [Actinoplanes sp. HUAS TT8]|uniref:VOC family protein n=1 Tax=Actinoplanes sp. HUAS TT8 TaxID=3447453 RepID=UPI003F521275